MKFTTFCINWLLVTALTAGWHLLYIPLHNSYRYFCGITTLGASLTYLAVSILLSNSSTELPGAILRGPNIAPLFFWILLHWNA